MTHICFLGGGNMASAIIAGLYKDKTYRITVVGRDPKRQQALAERFGITSADTVPELDVGDMLVLAVKPQDMQSAIGRVALNGALVVSIAAGLTTDILAEMMHGHRRIVRVMPNTPCQVGAGMSALFADMVATSEADRKAVETVMNRTGQTVWLPEEKDIDAFIGICGSGPAYVFYLMDALQQAARQHGFDDKEAAALSLATFRGAVALAEQADESFAALQKQVTSKGGTTYAAIQTFEQSHMAATLQAGVTACIARAGEMAEEFSKGR